MELPRIKAGHEPKLNPDGTIWIGLQLHGLATELDDESGALWSVCERMDGTRSPARLIAEVAGLHPDADPDDIAEMVDFLIGSGWVRDVAAPMPAELSAREAERYRRGAEFLDMINLRPETTGYQLQARLKASRVTVLGLGGVGSAAAMNLAASGIGELHCVDHDTVELSNLNRQLLFTEEDIGQRKSDAAVRRLRSLNSDITVTGENVFLDGPETVTAAAGKCDVIALCADEPRGSIQTWVNTAAYASGLPWLAAGYVGPKFSMSCHIPGRTACRWCLIQTVLDSRTRGEPRIPPYARDAVQSTMAASAQISGHYLAFETIRLLLGMPVQTAGRELHRYLIDYDEQYYVDARPRPDCPVGCGEMIGR